MSSEPPTPVPRKKSFLAKYGLVLLISIIPMVDVVSIAVGQVESWIGAYRPSFPPVIPVEKSKPTPGANSFPRQ